VSVIAVHYQLQVKCDHRF